MKRKILIVLILVATSFAGLILKVNRNNSFQHVSSIEQDVGTSFDALVLGDVEEIIKTDILCYDITYLDGAIWTSDSYQDLLHILDPETGAELNTVSIPIRASGITTDGTYIYAAVLAVINGTIVKLHKNGTLVSAFHIPLSGCRFDGLAWDGSHIWASQVSPSCILRVNPITGEIVRNLTITPYMALRGLAWHDNRLWGVDWLNDRVLAFDPFSGRVQEAFPSSCTFDTGLATNGTHFLLSELVIPGDNRTYYLDIPTEVGEVYNKFKSFDYPPDITWNGTHYFYTCYLQSYIEFCHDGNYEFIDSFPIPDPVWGITIVGDVLYLSQNASPYKIYKYTFDGVNFENLTGVGVMLESLAFDGTHLWAMGVDDKLYKLNPTDGSKVGEYLVGDYAGITYDWINEVLWIVSPNDNTTKQIYPNGSLTGFEVPTATTACPSGLTFNGKHLIMTDWIDQYVYKIIIGSAPDPPVLHNIIPTTDYDGIIQLNWSDTEAAAHYYIYRDTSSITSVNELQPIEKVSDSHYTDTITTNGIYYYVIVAGNSFGNSSISNCENVTVIIGSAPDPPVLHSIIPTIDDDGIIQLNWSDIEAAAHYYIYRDTSSITSVNGLQPIEKVLDSHYTDTITTNGIYYYVIVAGNSFGNSSISNCENVTIDIPSDGIPGFSNPFLLLSMIALTAIFFLLKYKKEHLT